MLRHGIIHTGGRLLEAMTPDHDRAKQVLDELNNVRSMIAGGYDCRDKRSPLAIITAALDAVRREEREACAKVAEAEEELPGPLPMDVAKRMQEVGLEESCRCLVRATKKSIAAAIRQGAARGGVEP